MSTNKLFEILKLKIGNLLSIERHGRTHKLEIMMRYKLRTRDLFSDVEVGIRMLAKRKLDLCPSKVDDRREIDAIFTNHKFR